MNEDMNGINIFFQGGGGLLKIHTIPAITLISRKLYLVLIYAKHSKQPDLAARVAERWVSRLKRVGSY